MVCPTCQTEMDAGSTCPGCGRGAVRPTLMDFPGVQSPGGYCPNCGAHNASHWTRCFACAGLNPAASACRPWLAGLLAALVGILAMATIWRALLPVQTVVYNCPTVAPIAAPVAVPVVTPIPVETSTIEIRSGVMNSSDQVEITAVSQSAAPGQVIVTRSGSDSTIVTSSAP
jgi:hypothetical protein